MQFEEFIWEEADVFYEKGTLTFACFYLNPVATPEEAKDELDRMLKDLTIRLRPWIEHYIWDSDPVKFHLNKYNGYEYIYGELQFGDAFHDEWLITSILFDMSKTYEDIYLHLRDNDGEFLLIEAFENLPEWLTPECSRNRDWINFGRVLIIPEEYYQDRGLRLTESLKFLERAAYRCQRVIEIDEILATKANEQPQSALETQCSVHLKIPRSIAGLLVRENVLNQIVLEYGQDIDQKPIDSSFTDIVDLEIRTTVLCSLFLRNHAKSSKSEEIDITTGKLITKAAISYIQEKEKTLDNTLNDEALNEYNQRGDVLQKELIRLMRIDKHVEPKFEFEKPDDFDVNEDDLMTKIQQFFNDSNAGVDGIENDKGDIKNSHIKPEPPTKIQTIDSDNELDELDNELENQWKDELEDEDEDEDEDEKAREFLKKANVSIDEDDFFEFFAKEALKLSDKDLEAFRNMDLHEDDHKFEQNTNGFKSNADFDDSSSDNSHSDDLTEQDEIPNNLTEEDLASMAELLKSLKQNPSGPISTFFQNL